MRAVLLAVVVSLGLVGSGGCTSEPTQPAPAASGDAGPKNSGADAAAKKGGRIPAPKAP